MLPDITTPQRKLTRLGQLALLHVRIKELANVRDGVVISTDRRNTF